jgi:hypothetical protein
VAVHQPPYSLDTSHCGYPYIGDAIDQAASTTKVWPDLVLSGHVHNYQRFSRAVTFDDGTQKNIPYIIAGAGGYATSSQRLHKIQKDDNGDTSAPLPFQTTQPEVQLEQFNDEEPGFLRVTVSATDLQVEYYTVPFGTTTATQFDVVHI